jgi:hypothetical protein
MTSARVVNTLGTSSLRAPVAQIDFAVPKAGELAVAFFSVRHYWLLICLWKALF